MGYSQENTCLESLFNKVTGLQDCCKTYLLHACTLEVFSLSTLDSRIIGGVGIIGGEGGGGGVGQGWKNIVGGLSVLIF